MVLPEYMAAMCDMNADSMSCDAGALCCSERPLLSQKQCHISSPDLYVARVSPSHVCTIVSLICSSSAEFRVWAPGAFTRALAGVHLLSWSLARQ